MQTMTLEQTFVALENHIELFKAATELGKDLEVGLESASSAEATLNVLAARIGFPVKLTFGMESEEEGVIAKEGIGKRILAFIKKIVEWIADAFKTTVKFISEVSTTRKARIKKTLELLKKPVDELVKEPAELKGSLLLVEEAVLYIALAAKIPTGSGAVANQPKITNECPFYEHNVPEVIKGFKEVSEKVKTTSVFEQILTNRVEVRVGALLPNKHLVAFLKAGVHPSNYKRDNYIVKSESPRLIEDTLKEMLASIENISDLEKVASNFGHAAETILRIQRFNDVEAGNARQYLNELAAGARRLTQLIRLV